MGFANAEYETLKLLQWPNDGIKYQKLSNEKKINKVQGFQSYSGTRTSQI